MLLRSCSVWVRSPEPDDLIKHHKKNPAAPCYEVALRTDSLFVRSRCVYGCSIVCRITALGAPNPTYKPHPMLLHAFQDNGNTLPHPYAHGAKCVTATGAVQLVDSGNRQTRAAGTQGVTQGDCAAIGIDAGVVVL